MSDASAPAVALLPWGDLVEDFLDQIGVSLETFCTEMDGGWLFGYVEALRRAGVRTVVICFSARVAEPTPFTHGPTGARFWVLPASKAFLRMRRRVAVPYGWTLEEMFGGSNEEADRLGNRLNRDVTPYLATSPRLLARTLRQEACDVVLCQEYEYPRFDVAVVVGRRLGLPVFATFQGGDWQRSRIERVARPRSLRASAGLIIPTRTEAERVRARYGVPDEKIAPIFNPLDVAAWTPLPQREARAAMETPPDAEMVAWHGRVDIHRKGLDVLLEAWRAVTAARPGRDLRLLLVGTGGSADLLRTRLADPVFHNVRWIDEYVLDRDRLRRYLAVADVYAFPSRHEGFPVALVEAMAAGLPPAAAAAPGVPDILGAGDLAACMVPREAPAALAAALGRLLDDPNERARLGAAARERAVEAFSLEAVGAQLRQFLVGDTQAVMTPPAERAGA